MTSPQTTTHLGYRDITALLKEGCEISRNDVIRRLSFYGSTVQNHGNGRTSMVYYFELKNCKIRGRVFSNNEIIDSNKSHDAIVQVIHPEYDDFNLNLDCHIYHDLRLGEQLKVKVSTTMPGKDPIFELFNGIKGFIGKFSRYELWKRIQVGSIVLVQIEKLYDNGTIIHPITRPLEVITE